MDNLTKILLGILLGIPATLFTGFILFFIEEAMRTNYSYLVNLRLNAARLSTLMQEQQTKMTNLPRSTNSAWAKDVQSLQQDFEEFQRNYESWKRRCFFSRVWSTNGIAPRAVLLLERVEHLLNVDLEMGKLPPAIQERDEDDNVLDHHEVLDEALDYLKDPEARVIGIYGTGGVGKTTLLTKINNYLARKSDEGSSNNTESRAITDYGLDHVVWATVSKNVDLGKLRNDIAQQLGISLRRNQNLEDAIRSYMKGKNFLLLLDDLWKPLKLEDLGIPNPHVEGSTYKRKVVFTTRDEKVCDNMRTQNNRIKVPFLSSDHAWQLFRKMLGDNFDDSNHETVTQAKAIAKRCGGLPLALRIIGAAMCSRNRLEDWEAAYNRLKKAEPILGTQEYLFDILKLSYDYLNDDMMRECFLCCALWPEDYNFKEEELIHCWMGLGLLNRHRVDDNYRIGSEYIQALKAVCC